MPSASQVRRGGDDNVVGEAATHVGVGQDARGDGVEVAEYDAAMRALAFAILLGGCAETASTTPPPAAPPASQPATVTPAAPTADDHWKRRSTDASCQENLATLVAGKLDGWKGLGRCGRIDAETALGSSGDAPSKFEQFGEYRVYPRPGGHVFVWFLSDDIRVLQLLYPKLPRTLSSLLGAPEKKVKSELSGDWDQWVYASRGLTAHVKRSSEEVVTLFAYQPTTVDAFLKTDIARVAKGEAPIEELR
jgi:hypothetical protein